MVSESNHPFSFPLSSWTKRCRGEVGHCEAEPRMSGKQEWQNQRLKQPGLQVKQGTRSQNGNYSFPFPLSATTTVFLRLPDGYRILMADAL